MIDNDGSETRSAAPAASSDAEFVAPGNTSVGDGPDQRPVSPPSGSGSDDDVPGWVSATMPEGVSPGPVEQVDLGGSQLPGEGSLDAPESSLDDDGNGAENGNYGLAGSGDEGGDKSSLHGPVGEQTGADKNHLRMARARLRDRAGLYGLDEDEVRLLAASGAMFSDVFELMLETDPLRRIERSEARARARVQYTGLMVPPRDVEDFIVEGGKTLRIDEKSYARIGKTVPDLMTAVRASAKVLGQIGRAYAEQYEFHEELLRLVEERRHALQVRRHAVPSYLIEFARLMESLGCRRNDLRSVDGKVVRAVRDALGFDKSMGEEGADEAEALRLRSWLAEGDALEGGESEPEDFDGLSRLMAQAVMDGDLEKAAELLRRLQVMDGLVDEAFGGEPEAGPEPVVEPQGLEEVVSEPIGDETIAGSDNEPASGDDRGDQASVDEAPGVIGGVELVGRAERIEVPRFDFTSFGEFAPDPAEQDGVEVYGRAQGAGRAHGALSPETAFGGVINLASGTAEVLPMWAREDRRSERADGLLGMQDWYRFEVPTGDYALTQMPRRLKRYPRVTDDLFPPYTELGRYAEEYGFERSVQRQVEQFAAGRVTDYAPALAVMRAAVNARVGEIDEDLARFWLFLLVGRHHMERIEVMFPHGFFHGVWAPDPASVDVGAGFFRIVRLLDDGDFADKVRNIGFPPVRGKDLMPGEGEDGQAV